MGLRATRASPWHTWASQNGAFEHRRQCLPEASSIEVHLSKRQDQQTRPRIWDRPDLEQLKRDSQLSINVTVDSVKDRDCRRTAEAQVCMA